MTEWELEADNFNAPTVELDKAVERSIQKKIKDHHARQMMALAMLHAGFGRDEIREQTSLSNKEYAGVYQQFKESNLQSLTKDIVESWECILKSKMISTTELAVDKITQYMVDDNVKDAKDASVVFATLFDKFRLVTGQSTENIQTITQKITQAIESRRGLQKPNQSVQSQGVSIDCSPRQE